MYEWPRSRDAWNAYCTAFFTRGEIDSLSSGASGSAVPVCACASMYDLMSSGDSFSSFSSAAHVGVRERVQQVFGIETAAAQLVRLLGRALQQLQRLLAERVGRVDRFARNLGGERRFVVGAEQRRRAATAEQRIERVQHALMPHQLTEVVIADRDRLALAVLHHGCARDGRPRVADIAKCGHGGLAPVGESESKGEVPMRCGAWAHADRERTTRGTARAAAPVLSRSARRRRARSRSGRQACVPEEHGIASTAFKIANRRRLSKAQFRTGPAVNCTLACARARAARSTDGGRTRHGVRGVRSVW